ncbi:hypothetical protein [Actinotalea sp. K2]|uniref:hypothetical protein n=1 Tax=Actinotalea sp. K2 TaxID=2939438 RepID=UPI002016B2C7|nr:hypothetical protein [Actinotalea sp. K2]MCL3861751.1 hypothetical protein [Actinotalea sp. K2]
MIESLLRDVDTARVLAVSAALQLDLRNVNELLLLQTLSLKAASLATQAGRPLSTSAIRRLLAADEIGGPAMLSALDQFEGFPVVEVNAPVRRFIVVEGQATGSADIAERLIRAVFGQPPDAFPPRFYTQVQSVTTFLLGLSDLLARRFERRTDERAPDLTRKVTVPSATRLAGLSDRVVFAPEELFVGRGALEARFLADTLLWKHGELTPSRSALHDSSDPAAPRSPQGLLGAADYPAVPGMDSDSSLLVRPLVDTHLGIVVASPTELATALRHFIIVAAHQHDCAEQLVQALMATVVEDVEFLFTAMLDEPLRPVEPTDVLGFTRMTAPLDGDKLLDLRVSVDTLDEYDVTSVWGAATHTCVDTQPLDHEPSRVLVIDLRQGVGRDDMYLGEFSASPTIFLTVDGLRTIFTAPGTDRLTLWYFAQARARLGETTRILSFSEVDTYALFRDSHDSFYLSDDPPPSVLSVTPGYGQNLRDEAARAAGPAFAPYGPGLARSLALHGDASPVRGFFGDRTVCFARLGDTTVWARGLLQPGADSEGQPERTLPESIVYWLWQLHSAEPSLLEVDAGVTELLVTLQIRSQRDRAGPVEGRDAGALAWVWCEGATADPEPPVRSAPTVGFTLASHAPWATPPDAAPNEVDRQLVAELIAGLVTLGSREPEWPENRRSALRDRVCPPGQKIMTQIVRADDDLLLWPGHLPPARRVNDAAIAIVLDGLGGHLVAAGFHEGTVPDAERTAFLNDHVTAFLRAWLERELDDLDGTAALRELAELHEALLHEVAADERRLPVRIACFGDAASDVQRIKRQRRGATTSSIALRFLIERLSAEPARGSNALTHERYDLLMALAAEIVNKGMLSDTLHGGLADHEISILPSGRLGISREQEAYTKATAEFVERLTAQTVAEASAVAAATDTIESVPDADLPSNAPSSSEGPLGALDPLAMAEYGFTYTQLVAACGAVIDASRDRGQDDVGDLTESEVLLALTTSSGLSEDVAWKILAALTLGPMTDYWAGVADVYPWRFNRDRSLLVRPVIRVADEASGDTRVLFGHRSLWLAPRRWLDRHLAGRLRANSKAMRSALAAQRDRKGSAFERRIEADSRTLGMLAVRRGFTRAGTLNLKDVEGEDLGDIDVLVATPAGVLVAIEAKDLETARTPSELVREVASLSTGPKAATERLSRRVAQVSAHLREVEDALGLAHTPGRRVVPLVVTNAPLLGSYLSDSPVAIVAVDELSSAIDAIERSERRRGH